MTYKLYDEHGNRLSRNYVTAAQRRAAKVATPPRPLSREARLAACAARKEKNAKRRERYARARAKEPHKAWQARLRAERVERVRQGWREYYMQQLADGKISFEEYKARLAQHGIHEDPR